MYRTNYFVNYYVINRDLKWNLKEKWVSKNATTKINERVKKNFYIDFSHSLSQSSISEIEEEDAVSTKK